MIEHDNIIYIRDFSEIGGVETFTWEMVKKYHNRDIAVVYKKAHKNQLKRVKKYCQAYRHTNQRIKCKVAIINYDVSIIDYIDEGAEIYQVVHGDYENSAYSWKPPTHERIKEYLGVTKYIEESFKRITGFKNVSYSYNPLTIENEEKKLVLVSATRLSRIKGKGRMIKLAEALDLARVNYVWYIFTNDRDAINSPNVVYMKPRLDIGWWMDNADYIVQLSDTEACSYTINEALYRNKPIIVTPLPYLKEIGVEDNKNAYIMEFDCSNIKDIVEKIKNVPKFIFNKLEDKYDKILVDGISHYKEEDFDMKVRALITFDDLEDGVRREANKSEWVCSKERAEYLLEHNAVEIVEEVKEEQPKINVEIKIDSKKVADELLEDPYKDFDAEKPVKKAVKKKKTSKK